MATVNIAFPAGSKPGRITKWRVGLNAMISAGRVVLHYRNVNNENDSESAPPSAAGKDPENKLRASKFGRVLKILAKEGEVVQPGQDLLLLEGCKHPTVMKDLCAECGADLREEDPGDGGQTPKTSQASVPMVHCIPELKVCPELAEKIGREDEQRLLRDKKLALLVDLDQTIVHTTNDNVPPDTKDVYHFQLYGPHSPWYHTRLRPGTREFLTEMSRLYELHICTFGARNYAHTVAALLDKDGMLFSHRILSRDECFDPASKTANLKALFPCGDSMVCIIDDREDVWQGCGNLVQVKPYHFFRHTGDIHAPPGLAKRDQYPQLKPASLDDTNDAEDRADRSENGTLPKVEEEKMKIAEENSSEKQNEEQESSGDTEKVVDANESVEEAKEEREVEEMEEITSDKVNPEKEDGEEKNKKPETVEEVAKEDEVRENNSEKNPLVDKEENKVEDKEIEKPLKAVKVEGKETTDGRNKEAEDKQELEDHDDYLLYLEDILRRIHAEFYEKQDTEVATKSLRDIIPRVRARVLKGLRLTFSGMVATHQKLHQSRAYKVARALGAEVSQDLKDDTTHLVAIKPGTAKVNSAKKMWQVKIVNPDWLWTCAERWECVDERLYPLTKRARGSRVPPPHCSSPERVEDQETEEADRFADSINPLMSFTLEEIANMDKEVEEDMSDQEPDPTPPTTPGTAQIKRARRRSRTPDSVDDDREEDDGLASKRRKTVDLEDVEDDSSLDDKKDSDDDDEDENLAEDEEEDIMARFRRGERLSDELDLEPDSDDSMEVTANEDDGEWNEMGAALEREFLSD